MTNRFALIATSLCVLAIPAQASAQQTTWSERVSSWLAPAPLIQPVAPMPDMELSQMVPPAPMGMDVNSASDFASRIPPAPAGTETATKFSDPLMNPQDLNQIVPAAGDAAPQK